MNSSKEEEEVKNTVDDDGMTPDERLQWLRDRGVLVETPEERRAQEITKIMKEDDDVVKETVSFVMVPHDTSKPLKELTFECPITMSNGTDSLMDHLKPIFAALGSSKDVDLDLFRKNASQTIGTSDSPQDVSEDTLKKVAAQGNVEKFSLVHPTASNHYTGVNIYLDEVGMLKRLPLNSRASEYATRAGYNPAPQFFGTVFLGRVRGRPMAQSVNFKVGKDTALDASWLQQATMSNLEHQVSMNAAIGRKDVTQAAVDGTDGTEKKEAEGYTWTQTEEEMELVVPLTNSTVTSKDVHVKYMPQSIVINCKKEPVLVLQLFERVDPDGCMWTLDRKGDSLKVVVTLEKVEQALWPRIKD
jgi:hypothetical protein